MTSDRAAARATWQRALALGDEGRPATAVEVCENALRRFDLADSPDVRAQILMTLACNLSELGDVPAALRHLETALQSDPSRRPAVLTARGRILLRAGHADALPALDEAIGALESLPAADRDAGGGLSDLAAALLNRGWLHMSRGRLTPAQLDTSAAERAAARANRPGVVHMARHNLGYARYLAGDLPGALQAMGEASDMMPEALLAVPLLDRAKVLLAAGLLTEAADFTDQAVEAFRANGAQPDLAEALLVEADLALRSGDAAAARAHAGEATHIYRSRDNEVAALASELIECRASALDRSGGVSGSGQSDCGGESDGGGGGGGEHRDADPAAWALADAGTAAELAARLRAVDLREDAGVADLLRLQAVLETGDPDRAQDLLHVAVSSERSSHLGTRLHGRLLAAQVDLAAGRHAAGMIRIRRGLDDLARFQAGFGSQDLQSGAAAHGRALARLGLRAAVATGSPPVILQWLERSRAVSTRLPEVRPPADAALAEDLGALRVAFDRARQAALAGRRDPALDRRVADLRRQIRSRSWTAAASGAVHRPASLATVRRALAARPGTSVLALFHGDGHDHALAVTARGARYRVLAESAHTEAAVRRLGSDLDLLADVRIAAPLRRVARHSLSGDLARLSGDLVEPMLEFMDDGPLLVVDAGPTAATPWGLLPALAGRAVSVTSSVTTAISGLAARPAAHDVGVLVVSGPDVVNGEQEAKEVAYLHPTSTLLTGADATGRAVLDAVPPDGLLHVAAHGHHEPDNPLFSGLLLADGLLFGYDVAPNPALPAHVVLSSCDVGRSHDRPGGEPLGLVAALIRSGVRTVVAATARLADDVAAPLMVAYHQALLDGKEPAAALADAIGRVGPDSDIPVPLTCFGSGTH